MNPNDPTRCDDQAQHKADGRDYRIHNNWFQNYRQQWIAEMLEIYGFIQRKHLMRKFQISTVQASKDLQRYHLENPDAMRYDKHEKKYLAIGK